MKTVRLMMSIPVLPSLVLLCATVHMALAVQQQAKAPCTSNIIELADLGKVEGGFSGRVRFFRGLPYVRSCWCVSSEFITGQYLPSNDNIYGICKHVSEKL